MRIAFIETRDKTFLLQAVADRLEGEVHWLVQNAAFKVDGSDNVTLLRYPRRRDQVRSAPDAARKRILERVRASDRTLIYFGRTAWHYNAYYDQIMEWFDRTQPDVIFGEPGSFWSHMVSLIAEDRGIPFLNPLSSRYPRGRFAFFEYDRIVPFAGEDSALGADELERIVNDITAGREKPDYMSSRRSRAAALSARFALLKEWVRGERFTAQSPILFARNARALRANRTRWDAAATPLDRLRRNTAVLYPLQMQPEMNLDVWGYEFRDQTTLVTQLADRFAKEGVELWVKPNPKSFYELSAQLTHAAISHPNVYLIKHDVQMSQVVDHVALVLTVTGSVAIERLLTQKPVVVFQEDYASWIGALGSREVGLSPETITLSGALEQLSVANISTPTQVIRGLLRTSYPGVISEPTYKPGVLEKRNVELLLAAFRDVLARLAKRNDDQE
jgi:hypothetical protein